MKFRICGAMKSPVLTSDAEDESVEIWSKSEFEGKTINKILGVVPKGTHPIFDNLVKAWKEKRSAVAVTTVSCRHKNRPSMDYP